MSSATDRSLDTLILSLGAAAPEARIQFRERMLAHGVACIEPLTALGLRSSDFTASVAAWLEELVKREPSTELDVRLALRELVAAGPDARYAKEALRRLGDDPDRSPSVKRAGTPAAPSANYFEVRAQVHQAAREGRILNYGDLNVTHWGLYGRWLGLISGEELASRHPPISAIVVTKATGRPGAGFYQLCRESGFAQPGETDEDMKWPGATEVRE